MLEAALIAAIPILYFVGMCFEYYEHKKMMDKEKSNE